MTFLAPPGLRTCHPQPQEEVVSTTATRLSKIGVVVIPVTDQERALEFYVDTLGFEKRADVPFGNGYRWV
jgi:catechol-2,3-dioxygenase